LGLHIESDYAVHELYLKAKAAVEVKANKAADSNQSCRGEGGDLAGDVSLL